MNQPMIRTSIILLLLTLGLSVLLCGGCLSGGEGSYTNRWLYPDDVSTVYVEMFDTTGFYRGYEYTFTDALCKRIEAQTPYKIVSDRNRADTVISGTISIGSGVLATDRHLGAPLEMETYAQATVTWKNLRTGDILVDGETVYASASYSRSSDGMVDADGESIYTSVAYSRGISQSREHSYKRALNRAAEKAVELMEISW